MTPRRLGVFISFVVTTHARCAVHRCDDKQSSRGDGAQSALANTNPCHDHAGKSFEPARRRMRLEFAARAAGASP